MTQTALHDHQRAEQDHHRWSADHMRALAVLRRAEAAIYSHEAEIQAHRLEIIEHESGSEHGPDIDKTHDSMQQQHEQDGHNHQSLMSAIFDLEKYL